MLLILNGEIYKYFNYLVDSFESGLDCFFYVLTLPERDFFVDDLPIFDGNIIDDFPDGVMFYPKMRFPTGNISYTLFECDESKTQSIIEAFNFLDENTVVSFYPSDVGEISVECSERVVERRRDYFIAGEGGPTEIVNTSRFYVILSGSVFLYEESSCLKPIVAIHEILHVLGFQHSSNPKSIMYNYSSCDQRLTNEIVDTLELVYETPSLPDLVFSNVSASKQSTYLSFEVTISNVGLKKSENVTFVVEGDGKVLYEYVFDNLNIGERGYLRISNLRVPLSLSEIDFVIDPDNKIKEIDESNNRVHLFLK